LTSQRIVIDWRDEPVDIADLVLEAGVVARVRVVWDDGSPASCVSLEVTLIEPMPEGADPRAGYCVFEGITDEQGEVSFGPIRDLVYDRIAIEASHPDAPTRCQWWDGHRVSARSPIQVSLSRGRVVRGRLLAPDGQPAAGYRIAPWGGETGDPEMRRAVTADMDGRFEVRGVGAPNGAIAVYDRVPETDPDSANAPLRRPAARVSGELLHIEEVLPGCSDLGVVSLPRRGTLTIRLDDARGEPVRGGRAFWMRSRIAHGGVGCAVGRSGTLHLRRIPLGIAIRLHLEFDDPQHGSLEQEFEIPETREETIVLRATGAGTVVFRLHPKGAPDKRLAVSHVRVGEHEHHGMFLDGPTSELRWWTRPGYYRSLTIAAKGFRERRIESVQVRDDGPTFLDVEIERAE
jgi:hypothetical protein